MWIFLCCGPFGGYKYIYIYIYIFVILTTQENKDIIFKKIIYDNTKYTLEKTDGAIKNEQSRDTGNIRQTRHEMNEDNSNTQK